MNYLINTLIGLGVVTAMVIVPFLIGLPFELWAKGHFSKMEYKEPISSGNTWVWGFVTIGSITLMYALGSCIRM